MLSDLTQISDLGQTWKMLQELSIPLWEIQIKATSPSSMAMEVQKPLTIAKTGFILNYRDQYRQIGKMY